MSDISCKEFCLEGITNAKTTMYWVVGGLIAVFSLIVCLLLSSLGSAISSIAGVFVIK